MLLSLFCSTLQGTCDVEHYGEVCLSIIGEMEKKHQIPSNLLRSLALAESGRKALNGRVFPWPWTVNLRGKSYFYQTKRAAVLAVIDLQKKGINCVDVGCMQINLAHHPKAFPSLDWAFDVRKNVTYAAQLLVRLRKGFGGSWQRAVERYHSSKPDYHIPYRTHVFKVWMKEQLKTLDKHSQPQYKGGKVSRKGRAMPYKKKGLYRSLSFIPRKDQMGFRHSVPVRRVKRLTPQPVIGNQLERTLQDRKLWLEAEKLRTERPDTLSLPGGRYIV